jgi:acid phosphatase type 7
MNTTVTPSRAANVYYGLSMNVYHAVMTSSMATTDVDAAVRISGLEPRTKYYYVVCSDVECTPPSTLMYFVTSPEAGDMSVSVRIHALGDPGKGNSAALLCVAAAQNYMLSNGNKEADMWMWLGDDAYNSGTDSEYSRKTVRHYGSNLWHYPVWMTLGNHDSASNSAGESGPYFRRFRMPRNGEAGGVPSNTAAYYSYDYGFVHVICLDSQYSSRVVGSPMLTWLANDLASINRTTTKWLIAFWHHPLYSKGSHDSDVDSRCVGMRSNVLPMLESAGVDLVLNGHSHGYERSYFVKGHSGSSSTFTALDHIVQAGEGGGVLGGAPYTKPAGLTPNSGFVAVTCGASNSVTTSTAGMLHPAMVRFPASGTNGLILVGSLVIDVNETALTYAFVLTNGTVADSFVLAKQ